MSEHKGREFEILQEVAELLDTLPPDKQKQSMAMLAARYGFDLKEKTTSSARNFRPSYSKKRNY